MKEVEATINGKQEKALELMIKGVNDLEVAKKIGVTRQTISNWRHKDAVFVSTLEEARIALREKHKDSLNRLVDKAIAELEKLIDEDDPKIRIQVIKLVLSMAGLKENLKEDNSQSKEEIIKEFLEEVLKSAGKELGFTEPGKG